MERVLARECWTPVERFGVQSAWQAVAASPAEFDVQFEGTSVGRLRWDLLGEHNRMNALAAIAAARHAGVPAQTAVAALSGFRNVKRRMEVRGVVEGVTVYDDFAHHPTAIATTVAGLRGKVGNARVIAVLEPRSNTMKQGVMKDLLAASLAAADRVLCYTGGLEWDAAAAMAPLGAKAACHADLDTLIGALVTESRAGDHILVMSNGSFGGLHAKLLAALAAPGAKH